MSTQAASAPIPPAAASSPGGMLSIAEARVETARKAYEEVSMRKDLPSWWSAKDAMTVSSAVLIFGLLICLLCSYLLAKGRAADTILKVFGTILIIVAALFLVVAGYSDQQIAPVVGLLGTIAGYLLGKDTRTPVAPHDTAPSAATAQTPTPS